MAVFDFSDWFPCTISSDNVRKIWNKRRPVGRWIGRRFGGSAKSLVASAMGFWARKKLFKSLKMLSQIGWNILLFFSPKKKIWHTPSLVRIPKACTHTLSIEDCHQCDHRERIYAHWTLCKVNFPFALELEINIHVENCFSRSFAGHFPGDHGQKVASPAAKNFPATKPRWIVLRAKKQNKKETSWCASHGQSIHESWKLEKLAGERVQNLTGRISFAGSRTTPEDEIGPISHLSQFENPYWRILALRLG